VKNIIQSNFPDIENGCLVLRSGESIEVKTKEKGFYLNDLMSVDTKFPADNNKYPFCGKRNSQRKGGLRKSASGKQMVPESVR
jgi:hypothetical protein